MITKNLNISAGLVNSTMGTVRGYKLEGNQITKIYIKLNKEEKCLSLLEKSGDFQGCYPLEKAFAVDIKEVKGVSKIIRREQFPLRLAFANTIHKVQGLTLTKVAVHMSKTFMPNMAYVAFSRCVSLEGLTIYDFNPEQIKCSKNNIGFLNNVFRNKDFFLDLPLPMTMTPIINQNDKDLKIFYQNVQNLGTNLNYIQKNASFRQCDFGCLSEIHNYQIGGNSNLLFPEFNYKFFDSKNKLHHGLLFLVRKTFNLQFKILEFYDEIKIIESLSLVVENFGKRIFICFLYISPQNISDSFQIIAKEFHILMQKASEYDECIFVGDFNENFYAKTKRINKIFERENYKNYQHQVSHMMASCLDQWYHRGNLKNTVFLHDNFYSDHRIIIAILTLIEKDSENYINESSMMIESETNNEKIFPFQNSGVTQDMIELNINSIDTFTPIKIGSIEESIDTNMIDEEELFQEKLTKLKKETLQQSVFPVCYVIDPLPLPNLGNSCYINSLLQILTAIPDFNDYINNYEWCNNNRNEVSFYPVHQGFLNYLHHGLPSHLPLVSVIKATLPEFNNTYQHDVHVFFTALATLIINEYSQNKMFDSFLETTTQSNSKNNDYAALSSCFHLQNAFDRLSFFREHYGVIETHRKCSNCGFDSYFYQYSETIDLKIPITRKNVSLYDCFQHTFRPDNDEFAEKLCSNCNQNKKHKILNNIYCWGKIIIFLIKRFVYDTAKRRSKKIRTLLKPDIRIKSKNFFTKSFNPTLYKREDLNPHMNINCTTDSFKYYKLIGCINHEGHLVNSGHYTATVWKNNYWYLCNDTPISIEKIDATQISKNGYMLIYRLE